MKQPRIIDRHTEIAIPRSISRFAAPFVTVAAMIDAGIFATLGPATQKAGSGILLAIVLAGSVALASGVSGGTARVRI